MRIFIELPTWLGDAVMSTPAIENIVAAYPKAQIVFFGSFVACELFKPHPNCEFTFVDDTKKAKLRLFLIFLIGKKLDKFDIAISFRSSFISKILLFGIKAKQKFQFKKSILNQHQVQKYINFVSNSLQLRELKNDLKLYFAPQKSDGKILALNPGASYGSAKRWYPQYFAQVALSFADKYEIVIFGGSNEIGICNEIEQILLQSGVKCKNLVSKTTISELCSNIATISQNNGIFITNDSGPMHIASAFKVKTIALFGPTKFSETSPWKNENAKILHLNLQCMPCMKRSCPLGTHECMKELTPKMVIKEIEENFIS
jgi:lipopolysaccharide heptosyltransferase II